MADNLSITQHIIPNTPQYTAPPAPQYAAPPAPQYALPPQQYAPQQYAPPPPRQYTPSFMQQQAYYASQPPIKNPLVGALIGLAGIIVILIILLICSIMGLFNNINGGSSGSSSSNSGGRSGRNNQFKNKKSKKSNGNDPSGWQLYTLQGCGHCDKQLEDLTNFNTYIKYQRGEATPIVNNIKGELYPREKITGFPLWYNSQTKEVKMGRQKNICDLTPKIKSENC